MSVTGKKTDAVTIKGTGGGLLVRIRDDAALSFAALLSELDERLQAGDKFFRQAKANVELGTRILQEGELEELRDALVRNEIELATIISGAQATRNLAKKAGITYKLPNNENTHPSRVESAPGAPFDSAEALFIRRTLRGGQTIQHHSDVIVLGDVNPGAEIIAGGNVIVWGTVRGKIQAGVVAPGEGAIICALSLKPSQLGIANIVAVGNQEVIDGPELGPEMARIQEDTIILESWMPQRTRFRR
ncbi:MAG TPA: septum site-determining protein MinC [Chloroflexia bacterium]|nr:septum site-determining protein MinC [Chloroflexia bacterium]